MLDRSVDVEDRPGMRAVCLWSRERRGVRPTGCGLTRAGRPWTCGWKGTVAVMPPYRYSGVEEVKPKARAPRRGALFFGDVFFWKAVRPSLFFLSWPLGGSERSAATFDAHRL